MLGIETLCVNEDSRRLPIWGLREVFILTGEIELQCENFALCSKPTCEHRRGQKFV